jgi:hypothetical protein
VLFVAEFGSRKFVGDRCLLDTLHKQLHHHSRRPSPAYDAAAASKLANSVVAFSRFLSGCLAGLRGAGRRAES